MRVWPVEAIASLFGLWAASNSPPIFSFHAYSVQAAFIMKAMAGKAMKLSRTRMNMITHALVAILLLIILIVVLPQFTFFHGVGSALERQNYALLGLAVLTYGGTYLAAAGILLCLDPEHLAYWPTVMVQFAAAFVDRLLPAGSGSIGVNYAYLRKWHTTAAEAGSIVVMNNLLGFVGCAGIVGFTLLLEPTLLHKFKWHFLHHESYVLALGATVAIVCVMVVLWLWGARVMAFIRRLVRDFIVLARKPHRLLAGLALSVCLTLLFAATFYLCVQASGVPMHAGTALVIFALSVVAGVVTPAPGGIGGAEAALVAGLVSFGVHGGPALAIALIFRFITYWLAIIVGAIAFVLSLKLHLFTEHL